MGLLSKSWCPTRLKLVMTCFFPKFPWISIICKKCQSMTRLIRCIPHHFVYYVAIRISYVIYDYGNKSFDDIGKCAHILVRSQGSITVTSWWARCLKSPASIVYPTVYSWADQRKYQSSASQSFVRGIHWWLVNSPHRGPVTREMSNRHYLSVDVNWYAVHN